MLTDSYGLPNSTGFDTVVAFAVKNPNKDVAVVGLPYRVTMVSGGTVVYTSSGSDAVSIAPGQSHVVALAVEGIHDTKPDQAQVQFYPAPAMFVSPSVLPDATSWSVATARVMCESNLISCPVTADITWNGSSPQTGLRVFAAVHQGNDIAGPIVGAGVGAPYLAASQIVPGQTVPIKIGTIGYSQPRDKGPLSLPAGPTMIEIFVNSMNATR